ncbi:MAG: amylo-alpha-1,6-glucosidase [Candidatus Tectimicrobiota bacterium]
MLVFGPEICTNLAAATQREWLETNGLGGFAASTLIGLNTRRYHGLLTAATTPPVGRMLLLAKLEETLIIDGQRFELSANQYPDTIHPQGYRYLTRFQLAPFPMWTYRVGEVQLEKTVFMRHGENSTVVQYTCHMAGAPASAWSLEIRPLIAFRDYHSTTHRNEALNPHVAITPGHAVVQPYHGLPALHCAHNADRIDLAGDWYYHFTYVVERERGLDDVEDLFHPFTLVFDLQRCPQPTIIASTAVREVTQAAAYRQAEIERRQACLVAAAHGDALIRTLVAAADHYIVARGAQHSIIAGYHWFSDWGRDTMIALPGLTLATGRPEVARSILQAFARVVDQGMLPNRFPDAGEAPEYNTVDATLWFFEAVHALWRATQDTAAIRADFYEVLTDIIDWHVRGTRYGIKVDDDGLLAAGVPGVQLTWMDARVDGREITPRHGKPVEIQALWYNALRIMAHLAQTVRDTTAAQRYQRMAAQAHSSFNRLFWHDAAGCLYDVITNGEPDGSIRPNQIFAVSLPYTMLPDPRAQAVVAVVERDLLTPYGLRSLSPADPQYRGRCTGNAASRDGSYHQGTVWAWLMGPFLHAYLKVHGNTARSRQQAVQWLSGFRTHLSQACLGQISEVFDGDAPHQPRGCVAQAWSVAELLRSAATLGLLGSTPYT